MVKPLYVSVNDPEPSLCNRLRLWVCSFPSILIDTSKRLSTQNRTMSSSKRVPFVVMENESLQIKSQAQNEKLRKNIYGGRNQAQSITKEPPKLRRL